MDAPEPLGGEAFNVGTGRRISLLDLVGAINRALGTDLEPEFRPDPGRGRPRLAGRASTGSSSAVLGYEPTVDFEEGLRRTLGGGVAEDAGRGDHLARLLAAIEARVGPGRDHRPGLRRAPPGPGLRRSAGFPVLGFDTDPAKVARLASGGATSATSPTPRSRP